MKLDHRRAPAGSGVAVSCQVFTLPPPGRPTDRTAFTLVELLVVIAVIGVLLSLTLPAVFSAREASRRTSCANNLRQIGLALQLHVEQEGVFPPGVIEWRPTGEGKRRQLAWSIFLLPFLEQQAVYDQLDLQQPFDSPVNAAAASQVLPVFVCPTSVRGSRLVEGRGPCDYGGITGERIQGANQPPKGILVYDRGLPVAAVRDGLAFTIIVGEDTAWPDGQWINGRNVFDQAFRINAAPPFENDIRSHHPSGAQVVMADSSVRFLNDGLDLKTLAALCTRAGGEPVGADAF
jgi:prepilin-type N-terminal cleavage/methylation domain-containing protein